MLGKAESGSTHHQCMTLHLCEILSIEFVLLGNGLLHLLRWGQLRDSLQAVSSACHCMACCCTQGRPIKQSSLPWQHPSALQAR